MYTAKIGIFISCDDLRMSVIYVFEKKIYLFRVTLTYLQEFIIKLMQSAVSGIITSKANGLL